MPIYWGVGPLPALRPQGLTRLLYIEMSVCRLLPMRIMKCRRDVTSADADSFGCGGWTSREPIEMQWDRASGHVVAVRPKYRHSELTGNQLSDVQ